jgi:2-polyprenyl-6-methoxyphenol hydroxylase-like FAD-dependent oxidoreductase
VIGAGIGGLTAAIALRRRGIEATVYERAPEIAAVGAGLTLWANAIRALRYLGVADQVIAAGARIERGEIRSASGAVLSTSRTGLLDHDPIVAIHRPDLHAVLLSALPENAVRLDAELVGFEEVGNEVRARFADGTEARADLLIGADGIRSVVRQKLFPEAELRYAGYTAWRGVVSSDDLVTHASTSESWGRGSRFGIVPIGGGRTYWFATANAPAGLEQTAGQRKAFLLDRFRGWHAPVEQLLERTGPDRILLNDICDISPMRSWCKGHVALLGDAAHPTTPNMGQGACMAIESSVVLEKCLTGESGLSAAFAAYERLRMPRTRWITRQSATIGRIGQLDGALACRLRDLALRLTPARVTERTIRQALAFDA